MSRSVAHCFCRAEEFPGSPNRLAIDRLGLSRGLPWAAFHPHGVAGGGNSPDGRIIVDSGLLNGDLLKTDYSREAAELYERETLRNRLDAIITREAAESRLGDHVKALRAAPRPSC